MSKVLIVVAALVLLSLPLFGQSAGPAPGTLSLGIGVETGVPMGDFSNYTSFGIGGLAVGSYDIDQNLAVNVKVGYLHFSGKDYTILAHTINTSFSEVPILVGLKYFFTPATEGTSMRLYGAADVGLYASSQSASATVSGINVSLSTSSTDFGVSPILGARFKAGNNMDVDAHVNYTAVFTSGSTTSWFGIGVGLIFTLGK